MEHLDNFQRQTEAIRRQLTRRGSRGSDDNQESMSTVFARSDDGISCELFGYSLPPARSGRAICHSSHPTASSPVENGNSAAKTVPLQESANSAHSEVTGYCSHKPESVLFKAPSASSYTYANPVAHKAIQERSSGQLTSPRIRHTLKSAAAAKMKGVQRSYPPWLQPTSIPASQVQHFREQKGKEQGSVRKEEAATSNKAVPAGSVSHDVLSTPLQQQQASHQSFDKEGTSARQEFCGARSSQEPQLDLQSESVSHLASGASDLRQRLEQRLRKAAEEGMEQQSTALHENSGKISGAYLLDDVTCSDLDIHSWYTPCSSNNVQHGSENYSQLFNISEAQDSCSKLGKSDKLRQPSDMFCVVNGIRLTDASCSSFGELTGSQHIVTDSSLDNFKRHTELIRGKLMTPELSELL